jgi:hypothetical protein
VAKRPTTAASKTKDIQDTRHPRPRPPKRPEDTGGGVTASYALPTRPGGMGRPHGRRCQVARLTRLSKNPRECSVSPRACVGTGQKTLAGAGDLCKLLSTPKRCSGRLLWEKRWHNTSATMMRKWRWVLLRSKNSSCQGHENVPSMSWSSDVSIPPSSLVHLTMRRLAVWPMIPRSCSR